MSERPARHVVTVEALARYRDRLDVRSPSEYADDHLPGAASHPVLTDDERAKVGTLHAQASAFAAKRVGAALVARNIAAMLETAFADKPREWAPLVYCWRGGKRSASLTHMLNEIGWRAVQLQGGYRAYRKHVRERLGTLPSAFTYRVVCGLTGSGKTCLIEALAAEGAQVLDLERLAMHRGSLLGDLPTAPQPSQKHFETEVLATLEGFDPARPVFVESESRRIGSLQVPEALLASMRTSACVRIEAPESLRVALLMEAYAHFVGAPSALVERLAPLVPLHGHDLLAHWEELARAGAWHTLVRDLLARHYDPTYTRSMDRNFPRHAQATVVTPTGIAPSDFRDLARELLGRDAATTSP